MNPNIGIRNSQGLKRVSARTRGLVAAMAAAGLLTLAEPALASLPQGHEVRAGQVVPEVVGKTMTIRQTSQAAKLDWKRFDIGQDHAVRIEQPNREAFLVNRVTGTMQSQIDGQLSATGKVYLVNPNGVVFGAGAQVDVGGLVAAGVGLADEQMAGTGEPVLTSQGATGDIEHSGLITVREGGVARLVGKEVNLRVGSRVRAPGADVLLEADAARFSGGSVHMEMGAEVHAFGGKVQIHSGHDLTLGHIRTHDLEIDGTDRRGSYRAKQKAYDGTRRGEVEAGEILGITFTEDSTLAPAFEFEGLGPGHECLWPRVEFREWLGRAEVRGGVTRDLPEHAGATIQSLGDEAARRRIDLPQFEKKQVGDATVGEPVNKTLTITQRDDYAVLDWKSFNVAEGHTVKFVQKDAQALAVNRIYDSEGSRIHGRIEANGRVFLFNPEGVLFGRTAEVNVGGLVAAAMLASDDALMDRPTTLDLSGNGSAEVRNQGEIKIAKGGVATLAAPGVVAQAGQVTAPEGAIHLASTERMTIDDQGRIKQVDGERREVKHAGTTSANDGEVKIYGGERDGIGGVVEAKGRGRIELAGTDFMWDLSGEIRPGRALLLSEVVFQVHEPTRGGTLSLKRLAQWLKGGADVEIRSNEGGGLSVLSVGARDVTGRLTLAARQLFLGRIEVPQLALRSPVRLAFGANDKTFDGSTRAEVKGIEINDLYFVPGSNLRLIPSFDFDSPDPGERLVSAKVFLTGYHGDEKHELRVIHDESPEGVKRRTATIFPKVDPAPMPDPDGKPGPEPIPITIPEPQPRPTPTPTPTPDVTPGPDPSPVTPDRPALPSRALAAIACEERREADPRAICDDLADPPPASSPPSLKLRGIRLPADARPTR